MNTTKHIAVNRRRTLVAPAVAFILVVACAVVPLRTEGAAAAQAPVVDAKRADQGLALTIGDVLFTSGRADLKPAAVGSLNKLVTFLAKYPGHNVAIHGYTDSVGSEEYNQGLSERRANSVKTYLASQGIGPTRLSALGMGQSAPVAGNDSGVGRQKNRRVEVIIGNPNPPAVLTPRARTARMLALLALLESLSGNTGRPLF